MLIKVPLTVCPYCGKELDATTHLSNELETPKPGDLSVCIQCAGLLKFNNKLLLKKVSDAEFRRLSDTDRDTITKYQMAIKKLRHGG